MTFLGKKFVAQFWLLLFVLVFLLAGCTVQATPEATKKISVVATTTIVGDVVNQIAGDQILLTVLLPAGADPHAFEPKPRHIAAIAEADLVFASGAGLEAFLQPLIQNAGGNARVVEVSTGVSLLKFIGEGSSGYDPHVWHNPLNVVIWVDNITQALSEADPEHASVYQANADAYKQKLLKLDDEIKTSVSQVPLERRLLVTDHDTFGYFADHYGFTILESVIPGFSSLSFPSAQELSALENQIRQSNVKAIFVGNTVNPAMSEQIASDTNAKVVFVYTDALSEPDQPAATYLQMMEYNAEAITAALK